MLVLYSTKLKEKLYYNINCSVNFWILELFDQTVKKHVKMHEYENYFIMTV